jgi:hypothetical protein
MRVAWIPRVALTRATGPEILEPVAGALRQSTAMLSRPRTLAGFLSLLYLVPALCLFALLLVCFTGRAVCPSGLYYSFPFSLTLHWLEWPWGELPPPGMLVGAVWGKVFIISSILLNATAIFALVKVVEWLAAERFAQPRAWGRQLLARVIVWQERLLSTIIVPIVHGGRRLSSERRLDRPQLIGATVALLYAIPGLFFYVDALISQGFLCDLGAILWTLPWSLVDPWRSSRPFLLVVALALNAALLYLASSAICRLAQGLFRPRRGLEG